MMVLELSLETSILLPIMVDHPFNKANNSAKKDSNGAEFLGRPNTI